MSERRPVPKFVLPLLFGAVTLWGVFIAVGAYLRDGDVRKLGLVLACVAAFLAIWAGALALAQWRSKANNKQT